MYEIKTKVTNKDVLEFVNSIEDLQRQEDCLKLLDFFNKETKLQPKIWGNGVIGFGKYSYESKSGCVGTWFITGFSSRKAFISIYVAAYNDKIEQLKENLGKAKFGKGCINVKKLDDIDLDVLKRMVKVTLDFHKKNS